MLGFLLGLFSMGLMGAVIIILILAGLFMVGASTTVLFWDLLTELGHPLEFEGFQFLIPIFVVSIALLLLSSLGPLCTAIGKSFIIANFILIIGAMIVPFFGALEGYPNNWVLIISTIVSLIVGFATTEGVWDFITDSPVLSILSAIPSCFFIFTYIWLMKEELNPAGSIVSFAKESLVITIVVFVIFTALEVVNIVRNRA